MFQGSARKLPPTSASTLNSLHSLRSIDDRQGKASRSSTQTSPSIMSVLRMQRLLSRKIANKKRYHFQILKQFFLFPDSSMSQSLISVGPYDKLLFSDQKLHSMLKIMETQLIARKIWGFINLKMQKKLQEMKQFAETVSYVTEKVRTYHQNYSFSLIKSVSSTVKKHKQLQTFNFINIAISGPKSPLSQQKSIKLQANLSRRTAAQSQHEQSRRRGWQQSCCSVCCTHCCCCQSVNTSFGNRSDYDLWQRIQYMKRLQEMVEQSQRGNC